MPCLPGRIYGAVTTQRGDNEHETAGCTLAAIFSGMAMTTYEFCQFADSHHFGYNHELKDQFLREARNFLSRLALHLGLAPGSFEIRTNRGGIAAAGEVSLHHDRFVICLDGGIDFRGARSFYWRTCQNRRDYTLSTGGANRWVSFQQLGTGLGYSRFLDEIRETWTPAPEERVALMAS